MAWRSPVARLQGTLLAAVIAILLTIAACGSGDDPEPTPLPTDVAAVEPTFTPTPEPEPTATSTPEPTATPTMYVPAPTVAAPLHQPPPQAPAAPPPPTEPAEEPVEEPTAAPEPEPEPEQEGNQQPEPEPEEGSLGDPVISHPLTGLAGWEIDYARAIPVENGFQIVNTSSDGREIWEAAYLGEQLGNVVAVLDVTDVGASYSGYACLAVRTSPGVWEYAYAVCLNGYGESFADFKYVDVDGNYIYEELAPFEVREGTRPVREWNTLVIAASGQDFAFYINDTLLGTAIHPSIESGGISFGVGNLEEASAEWVFANLEVWEIQ